MTLIRGAKMDDKQAAIAYMGYLFREWQKEDDERYDVNLQEDERW